MTEGTQQVEQARGAGRDRRIAWSAGMGLFQRVAQGASTLVLMPLLLHTLGAAQFGIWGAAASLAWLTTLLDIGTGAALVTLVARSSATENTEEARQHLAGALTFGCGLAMLMLLVALGAMLAGIPIGTSGPYLIAVIGLALNVPLNAANNVWMALQKGYVAASWELVQTVLTFVGLIAAAKTTNNLLVYVAAVYVGLVAGNLGSLVHLLLWHKELRPDRESLSIASARAIAGEGMLYFLLGISGGLSFFLDNILALQLLGPEASAQMTIAMRICMSAIGVLLVISQPLWPAFTEAAHRADYKWINRTLYRSSALLFALTSAGSAILILFGQQIFRFWLRTDLGIGRGLLWAISAWVVSQALGRTPGLLLNGLSKIRFQTVLFFIASSIGIVGKIGLASRFGVSGILSSTTFVVLVIVVPASFWKIRDWEGSGA